MRFLLLLMVATAITTNSFSQETSDWKHAATNSTGNAKYFINSKKANSSDGVEIKAWVRVEYKVLEHKGRKYANGYGLYLWEIDMDEEKFRIISMAEYTSAGKLIYSSSEDYTSWSYMVPNSIAEIVSNQIADFFK